jgi:hypothetical protein
LFGPWHLLGECVNDAVSYLIAKGNRNYINRVADIIQGKNRCTSQLLLQLKAASDKIAILVNSCYHPLNSEHVQCYSMEVETSNEDD